MRVRWFQNKGGRSDAVALSKESPAAMRATIWCRRWKCRAVLRNSWIASTLGEAARVVAVQRDDVAIRRGADQIVQREGGAVADAGDGVLLGDLFWFADIEHQFVELAAVTARSPPSRSVRYASASREMP